MITTYGDLKSAIADRIDRADSTTAIEDAVDAATMRLSRLLRIFDQESLSEASATSEYVLLPTDFGGMRRFSVDGVRAEYAAPDVIQTWSEREDSPQKQYFTIEDAQARMYPSGATTAAPVTVTMLYHKRLTELVDDSDANWLLTDHPDIYLAASMVEISLRQKNDEAVTRWERRLELLTPEALVASRRRRYPGGQLVVREG